MLLQFYTNDVSIALKGNVKNSDYYDLILDQHLMLCSGALLVNIQKWLVKS